MFNILKNLHFSHFSLTRANYSKSTHSKLFNLLENMPKDTKHIAAAQKHRKKVKEKHSKYVPGRVTLQVLGTGAVGAPRALYMFSDQSRYLFNCGEGTQRLAHEHKMKLAKLEHIFITQPVWRNIGGLPGIALTIQDVGVPEITLHGPPGLDNIFTATKRFVVLKDLKIHMAQCADNIIFEDNVMTVRYVPLTKPGTEEEEEEEEISPNETVDEVIPEEESTSLPSAPLPEGRVKDTEVEAVVDQFHASTSTRRTRRKRKKSSSVGPNTRMNFSGELNDNTDYYAYEHSGHISPEPSPSTPEVEETKSKGISMAYVCTLKPRPGALNLDKCVKMGVRPGPLLGKLKAGEDVKLLCGKIVSSKEVCEPEDPGLIFIVVDCPTVEYLDSLSANEVMKKHQKYAECERDIANVVVHFSPQNVVIDQRYQEWMNQFPSFTTHLMLNEFNTCMGSEAVHRIQYKLNLLSQDIFPILGDKGTKVVDKDAKEVYKKPRLEDSASSLVGESTVTEYDLRNLQRTPTSPTASIRNLMEAVSPTPPQPTPVPGKPLMICPRTFCTFHLRPKRGLDRSNELTLYPREYIDESLSVHELNGELRKLKIKMMKKTTASEEYPKLLFLGTGSCIPNKTRNTSGILLSLGKKQHILLDCGEGTYGQIVRFYGPEEAHRILANIDAIYISHLHADHHIGLIGILQGRRRAIEHLKLEKRPLYLFAPRQIMTWLSFYDRCFESILPEFELVPNSCLIQGAVLLTEPAKRKILEYLNIGDINTCVVKHCPNAFGVALMCKNGYKLTYSGDTMPSDNLVNLGMSSHILIHEATMEDELIHEAVVKMHSTTNQAIQVGRRMKAKNIILTHFSQRYAKLPRFNDNFGSNVGIAFDNMQVRISDLSLTPELYPALKVMFAEQYEELENKSLKRQIKELTKRKTM